MTHPLFANISHELIDRVNHLDLTLLADEHPKQVNKVLGETVLCGGKRLRPLLTFLMGNLFAVEGKALVPYAKAIEMVHGASLAHDDVIDNATTRRGKASLNIVTSNKKAVLAGDILLADVIVMLTDLGNLQLVKEMSVIIKDLSEGEWLQLDASDERLYSRELLAKIAYKKTSSVMSWCCFVPAILAQQSESVIKSAREFGTLLGHAFQLMDDTLDFNDNGEKDALLDLKNGQINGVLFEWMEENLAVKKSFQRGEEIDRATLFRGEGIARAIAIVKQQAHDKLAKAHAELKTIERELALSGKEAEDFAQALIPLHLIIQYLGERKL